MVMVRFQMAWIYTHIHTHTQSLPLSEEQMRLRVSLMSSQRLWNHIFSACFFQWVMGYDTHSSLSESEHFSVFHIQYKLSSFCSLRFFFFLSRSESDIACLKKVIYACQSGFNDIWIEILWQLLGRNQLNYIKLSRKGTLTEFVNVKLCIKDRPLFNCFFASHEYFI